MSVIITLSALLAMQAVDASAAPKPSAGLQDFADDYENCIDSRNGGTLRITGDPAADRRRMDMAIRHCRQERARAAAEAERILAADPDYADAGARTAAIEQAFAEVDDRQRSRLTTIYRQYGNAMRRSGAPPLRGEASTGALRTIDRPRPSGTTSIDVPFQIMPAYMDYTACIDTHFAATPGHDSNTEATVRQAYAEAVTQCRPVRAQQLARAYAALDADYRPFANLRAARQAADEAFARAESDFEIEPVPATLTRENSNADHH